LSHRISTFPTPNLPQCEIVLVGRKPDNKNGDDYFQRALREINDLLSFYGDSQSKVRRPKITYEYIPDIWEAGSLDNLFLTAGSTTCVIHTAGPYSQQGPVVLDACIDFKIPVYVDVSDPIDFLKESLERHEAAIASGTTAILAAGAFPGMSNIFAMEAASAATEDNNNNNNNNKKDVTTKVKDVRFNYFTKGLGGSGTINLYITNIGFGDAMVMYEKGKQTSFEDLSGRLLGKVDFFINDDDDDDSNKNASWKKANDRAKERVGTQKVFAWPFPEAATVASELSISGASSSAMGTAPDLWNDMLGLLVDLVPRNWWPTKFSKFLADFSEPLVLATDFTMRKLSSSSDGDCGETHAMRVDVVVETTDDTTGEGVETMVSIVQCHDSFRRCVGQSCAEFALDAWFEYLGLHAIDKNQATKRTGVYLPEQRYRQAADRERIVSRLTSTPGTFCYTGPVKVASRPRRTILPSVQSEDRIVLNAIPAPGFFCNETPLEIRFVQSEEEDNTSTPLTEVNNKGGSLREIEVPVYPTEVREIVQAMKNRLR